MYVLADASGSTVRDGFHEGVHLALPHLVHLADERDARFCLAAYGDDAGLRVALIGAGDLTVIPRIPAGGLSSLAAGLRVVAAAIEHDTSQLRSDGMEPGPPATLVLAHGLGTDRDEAVLEARRPLAGRLHVSAPGEDRLAFTGLGATVHPMRLGDAGTVAASVVTAARQAWPASGSTQ
ncbi:hypothetical protein SAMN05421748_12817 [Paractinoplanes atraurantiacus]|uniref:VWFA domain-containing protein n=2 Tax=Paractinoplanes atraurantiacus TaxID=1036182 RepID=A0A285JY79_9ACTN|nr:hypothetical protein SAMN05421748_12817 [Actinoplanes atraurantiacus]